MWQVFLKISSHFQKGLGFRQCSVCLSVAAKSSLCLELLLCVSSPVLHNTVLCAAASSSTQFSFVPSMSLLWFDARGKWICQIFSPWYCLPLEYVIISSSKGEIFSKKIVKFYFCLFWRIFILGASNITENVCQKWQKLDLTSFFENTPPIEQQSRALILLESWSYIPEPEPLWCCFSKVLRFPKLEIHIT